ncbi:MAG: ComF family protein [Deltaproteobacteria bacterium]|nr:ComF family protein [Deltaproteobacteria bacterium]
MKLLSGFMDLIYPSRCGVCGVFLREDGVIHEGQELDLCRPCFNSFVDVGSPICPVCGKPFASGAGEDHLCADCLATKPFFAIARAPYLYEGLLMTAIHELKYARKTYLARFLGPLLASYAAGWLGGPDGLLIMPVPLHPRRLRKRGFNQSLLLARHVAFSLKADLDYLSLRRTRFTQPQTALSSEERKRNVRKAFDVVNTAGYRRRTVLLIDDVATTGSTLNECAGVLKKAGVKDVYCLTLARTATG